jgi:hypothetical protein
MVHIKMFKFISASGKGVESKYNPKLPILALNAYNYGLLI